MMSSAQPCWRTKRPSPYLPGPVVGRLGRCPIALVTYSSINQRAALSC